MILLILFYRLSDAVRGNKLKNYFNPNADLLISGGNYHETIDYLGQQIKMVLKGNTVSCTS